MGPRLSAGDTAFSASALPHRGSSEAGTQSKDKKPEHRTIKRVKKRKESSRNTYTITSPKVAEKHISATAKTGHDPTMAVKKQKPNVLF